MNIVFIGLMCVFVVTLAIFAENGAQTLRRSRQQMTINYVKAAETTFSAVDVHLTELMTRMLNANSSVKLRSGNSYERYAEARQYYELLKQKCSSVSGLDIAFMIDLDGNTQIWAYGDNVTPISKMNFRSFLESKSLNARHYNNLKWHPYQVEQDLYYIKLCSINGFVIGAFCDEKHFDQEIRVQMKGADDRPYEWFIYDQDHRMIYRNASSGVSDETLLGTGRVRGKIRISQAFDMLGGTICFLFPEEIWSVWKNTAILFVFIFWTFCFILERVIYRYLRRLVEEPVERLVVAANDIIRGNYDASVDENGQGEMLVLEKAFNSAIRTVVGLRIDSYEQELHAKEQELVRLRQQLRPHFYLNALAVVKGMAYQRRTEEIQQYIDALTIHIRYLLNNNNTLIPLGDEFEHVVHYVNMQKICMPGRITAFILCDPACRAEEVPYLLLHTIVENAFKHARSDNNSLMFTLSAGYAEEERGRVTLIEYEDTGGGFAREELEHQRDGPPEKDAQHVGLANLRKTLEIQYGEEGLMKLSNVRPHGARIEIRIPSYDGKADAAKREADRIGGAEIRLTEKREI